MNTLLSHLAKELDGIRNSQPTEPFSLSPLPELDALVSVAAEVIRSQLGDPCDPTHMNWPPNTLVYLFHKLPTGWRGGGAELHITLDANDCCESAAWRFSR